MTSFIDAGLIFIYICPVLFCVVLITCCVAMCCWCRKRCHRRREPNVVTVSSVMHPPPPVPSCGCQPSCLHYQPVPFTPGYSSAPVPSAPPPSYQEATDPSYFNMTQGGMMYHSVPQQTDGNTHQPFNPAYCPPRYDQR